MACCCVICREVSTVDTDSYPFGVTSDELRRSRTRILHRRMQRHIELAVVSGASERAGRRTCSVRVLSADGMEWRDLLGVTGSG